MANGAELAMILRAKEDSSVKSAFDGIKEQAKGLGDSIKAGFGAAIGGSLFEGVKAGFDTVVEAVSGATEGANRLQAQLGLTAEEASALGDVAQQVFRNNFGSDIGEVNQTIATVQQNLGKISPELTKQATEAALTIQDLFEAPANESTRTVSVMMKNFQGLSQTDAFDIITRGFQQGGNYSDELLDTLREYAPQFASLGLSADQAMGILVAGANAGAFNLDKVGDAVKEFNIRAQDGSKSTAEGFSAIGLNADQMASAIAAGGPKAEQAFQMTLAALASIEDPLARNQAGVKLFSTQWEDLGPTVVTSMAEGIKGIGDFQGATDKAAEAANAGIGPAIETMKRQLIGLGVDAILPLMPALTTLVTTITTGIQSAIPVIREIGAALAAVFTGGSLESMQRASDILGQFFPPALASAIIEAVRSLGAAWQKIFAGDIPGAIQAAKTAFSDMGKLIVTAVDEWAAWFAGWVDNANPELLSNLGDLLVDVLGWLQKAGAAYVEQLATWAAAFLDWVGPMVPDLLRELGALLVKVVSWLADDGLPTLVDNLGKWGMAFIEWIGPRIPPMLAALGELLVELGTWILTTALPAIVSKLVEWGSAFVGWVAENVLPKLPGALATIGSTVLDWIAGGLDSFGSAAAGLGRAIIDGIANAISNGVGAITAAARGAAQSALDAAKAQLGIQSPSLAFRQEVGLPIVQGMTQGILENGQMAVQAAVAMAEAARQAAMAAVRGGGPSSSASWNAAMSQVGASIGMGIGPGIHQVGPLASGSIVPGLNNTPSGSIPIGRANVAVYIGDHQLDDVIVRVNERIERAGRNIR